MLCWQSIRQRASLVSGDSSALLLDDQLRLSFNRLLAQKNDEERQDSSQYRRARNFLDHLQCAQWTFAAFDVLPVRSQRELADAAGFFCSWLPESSTMVVCRATILGAACRRSGLVVGHWPKNHQFVQKQRQAAGHQTATNADQIPAKRIHHSVLPDNLPSQLDRLHVDGIDWNFRKNVQAPRSQAFLRPAGPLESARQPKGEVLSDVFDAFCQFNRK